MAIKDLSPAERSHFRQWMGGTLAGVTRTRERQAQIAREHYNGRETCPECRVVARKLGREE